jgi:competence protein ComEA
VRLSSRRSDDADVIRARLRALLADQDRAGGWLPDDELAAPGDWDGATDDDRADGDRVTVPSADDQDAGLPAGVGRHRTPATTVRWDPGRGGVRSLWLAGLVAALFVIGWTWLQRPAVEPVSGGAADAGAEASTAAPSAPPSSPPVGEAADSSATVVVSVVGLVARPGLVTLPTGARVADALEAAGGLLPEADPAAVNLAAVVTDGQQVAVGVPAAPGAGPAGAAPAPAGPLDLNTAGVAELDSLPGIGPVLAQRIVDHRSREGPFTSVDQLDDVPGIGPSTAAELAGLVRV